jgi:hypothetical protein
VLKLGIPDINLQIMRFLCKDLLFFCKQKISSNVVECAVKVSNGENQKVMFDSLSNKQVFTEIMTNEFGNYVIYAAIFAAKESQNKDYFESFISVKHI